MNQKKNMTTAGLKLDPWQKKVLETKGNICLRSGRQVGKSTIIGIKAAKYALENSNKLVMVISKVERQAQLLFSKILNNLHYLGRTQILKGKDRPTKHKISLKNGSVIHCLPAGDTGFGLMGYTIDLLIADEAAFIPEEVWNSIIPALAITRGNIWLLSTPFLKEGYYYKCFNDKSFTTFHESSEDCPRRDDEFLEHKKKTLTRAQYAQMYLGLFVDELKQFFTDELILKCCTGKEKPFAANSDYYLGVDIARMGEDESTFEIIDRTKRERLQHVHHEKTIHTLTTDTTLKILELNSKYNFRQIYVDSGGMGVGVFDQLLTNEETKNKVISINDERRPLTPDEKKRKKVIKEDIYNNLKMLMERGEIELLNDDEVKASLKSVQYEYLKGKFIISGQDTHIAEGLIRAAYCAKDKHLKLWVSYSQDGI